MGRGMVEVDNRAAGSAMVDIRGEVSVVALTTDYDANDYLGEALDGVHLWFSYFAGGWVVAFGLQLHGHCNGQA